MEIHRLKPMEEDYPKELFNRLYKETESLRRSLAHQINPRRYNVSKDIIQSWFDDKFIFVFNKHFKDKDPDILKGFIINSLQTFKYRILRKAYSKEGEFYTNLIELEGDSNLINYIPDSNDLDSGDIFFNLVLEFFKKELSDDAYILLNLQLNPPPYILNKLPKSNSPIPVKLYSEFLNLPDNTNSYKYIKKLKKDIAITIEKAKLEFNSNLALSL